MIASTGQLHIEDVEYEVGGQHMVGHLAFDDGTTDGRRPAVLLSHEGSGLDEHVKGRAEQLASLGFVAFALDYFGDGRPLPLDEAMVRLRPLMGEPDLVRRLARAGLDVLLDRPQVDPRRVAAIGYCFGGVMSMELARAGAELRAVVGFHPGFTRPNPDDSRKITASVLLCCGADDPFATPEQRLDFEGEMREAGVADWRMELYGGVGHSFTNPAVDALGVPGLAYNAAADRRSWRSMLDLFDEVLTS